MTIRESLHCAVMVLLCGVLLGAAIFIFRLPKIVNHQADVTRGELLASEHVAEQDAAEKIGDALDLIDRRSGEGLAEVHRAAGNADARTSEALDIVRHSEADANKQLATFNGTLSAEQKALAAALDPIAANAAAASKDLPGLVRDSRFFIARAARTAGHVEQMADVIEHETPKMTANVDMIAGSSVGIAKSTDATGKEVALAAKRFNAPQTKWQQFRMWLLTVARIAGDF